jgi:hypothetical protein
MVRSSAVWLRADADGALAIGALVLIVVILIA